MSRPLQPEEREALRRADIVKEALSWLGTPYRHQASQKGQGTDCLGLVRGIYRASVGAEPELPPAYGRKASPGEVLLEAAERHLRPAPAPGQIGDVLLFRLRRSQPVRHCGVLIAPNLFIHAHDGQSVTSASLIGFWGPRLAGIYAYPEQS